MPIGRVRLAPEWATDPQAVARGRPTSTVVRHTTRPFPEADVSSPLEGNTRTGHDPVDVDTAYAQVQRSEQFQTLRRKHRGIVFPLTALFLAWYALYVLLADYAHDFMSKKVTGNITVGLVMGLLQFVSTFVITTVYVRYANRNLDPLAAEIRDEMGEVTR
jgi:uncharacterized membrane protein (DUF485 family)